MSMTIDNRFKYFKDINESLKRKYGTQEDFSYSEMAPAIDNISSGGSVEKKDVNFYDWEGTLLFGYSAEEVQAMTSLPAPDTSPNYQSADHDLLTFQEWNWSFANIKTWVQNHSNQSLGVGAIYTTTDLQNHNYWNNPRLTNAKSIYMQKRGVTSIDNNVFQSCYSLTAINIPDGVTSIDSSAFQSCYSLTAINIPFGVTAINPLAFYQCYSLKAVNIPDGTTLIGRNSFGNCYSLVYVNIPKSVTSIGGFAFNSCSSLLFVNIPDDVSSILANTFVNCFSLTKMNIPFNVSSIGDSAFRNCSNLHDVVIRGKPALSNTDTFGGAPSDQKLYVHRSDLSWYETETNWSTIYAQGKIVAAADYLDHLISIGIDVTDFENEVISE